MQIYELLKNDHREVKSLLDQLIAAEGAEERSALIAKVRDALVPHSRAEEAVFYNSLREYDRAKDKIGHSFVEHLSAETILRGLQVQEKVMGNWQAGARKLKEALDHHIAEEEGELFSLARQFFTEEEANMMGGAFEKLKAETVPEGFMKTTLDLVVNMMPPRFTKGFRDFDFSPPKA
jgi:hemerythrin superfamily protein